MTSSEPSDRVRERRDEFWRGVGQIGARQDPLGGVDETDLWPSGSSGYVRVMTVHSGIIATDGLSDPAEGAADQDAPAPHGFGLELYIEGTQLMDAELGDARWLVTALEEAAGALAGAGATVRPALADHALLSLELSGDGAPQDWVTEGRLGALIGVDLPGRASGFDVEGGQVRALTLTPLRPSELAAIAAEGPAGRQRVADALATQGWFSYVDTDRPAVL